MTRILLIFGGVGSEHEVSRLSAENVLTALRKTDYEITKCEIAKNGTWSLSFDDLHSYDVIFPLIHGKGGEDGAISALGELIDVPVVGCDTGASTLAWDKDLCKQFCAGAGIPVVPWRTVNVGAKIDYSTTARELDSEILFVKPAREGSSVGVSKITNADEFNAALNTAFEYDDKVLIEKAIIGRELECAILGNSPHVDVTDVGEIKPPERDFYSYDEKYSEKSCTNLDIPARNIDAETRAQIQNYAKQAYNLIGGRGLARIDFFYDETAEQIYLNEINTMPGFTNISMYPKLWEKADISYPELLKKLIELAQNKR